MFTLRWRILRVGGIPISVDASWLIILALFTWTFHQIYLDTLHYGGPTSWWLLALATSVCFFACIVLHELGHAFVARAWGIPMAGINLFLFGGVAEMRGEPTSAKSEFFMASAGPLVTVVLTALFAFLGWLGTRLHWPLPAVAYLNTLTVINLIVLIFNLIPAFPLDGGRILRSALWGGSHDLRRATQWAAFLGQAFAWMLIGYAVLLFITDPRDNLIQAMWAGLIGLFLNSAARSSYEQVVIRQALAGEPVGRFMNREPITVRSDVDLRTWVEDYVYRFHRKFFPVVDDGHLRGFITTQDLANYPRERWPAHTVGAVMRTNYQRFSLAPQADALAALGKMQATGASRLLVLEGDRLVGIVSLKDLLRFLHLKLELEDHHEGTPPAPPTKSEEPRP